MQEELDKIISELEDDLEIKYLSKEIKYDIAERLEYLNKLRYALYGY